MRYNHKNKESDESEKNAGTDNIKIRVIDDKWSEVIKDITPSKSEWAKLDWNEYPSLGYRINNDSCKIEKDEK